MVVGSGEGGKAMGQRFLHTGTYLQNIGTHLLRSVHLHTHNAKAETAHEKWRGKKSVCMGRELCWEL